MIMWWWIVRRWKCRRRQSDQQVCEHDSVCGACGLAERSQLADIQSFYDEGRYNNMALILNATTELHGVYGRYGYGHGYVHGKKRDR